MTDKYDDYSREDLIRLIRERDRKPKFGLLWERDEIDHDRSINSDFVALEVDPDLSCGDDPHPNLVIEGDNFDALRYLRMTHAGQAKVIYIDPPYNTGNKDFIYNDCYVDRDDAYRHSKWLEFMYRRLELAKDLLAEDGLIFVSIDDNEAFHLGLLMEQIFGMKNFVGCFLWRKVDSPNDNKVAVTPDHEFILCYAMQKEAINLVPMEAPHIVGAYPQTRDDGVRFRDRLLKKNGANSLRRDRPTMFFPIADPDGNDVYPIHDNGEEARWSMGKDGVAKHLKANTLVWKKRIKLGKEVWEPYTREYAPENPVRPYPTIWTDLPTMRQAKAMLRDIFDTSDLFSTPKPVELIQRMLRLIGDPDALVIDFFAGSGTTAHAVLEMNQQDGGNRRFILVSSTEATEAEPDKNICRDICAERVRRVIKGYTNKKDEQVEGLPGSFAYMRTRRIPSEKVFSKIQHEQIWTAIQLIHTGSVSAYLKKETVQKASTERGIVLYVPKISESIVERLLTEIQHVAQATIYSWQPALLEQRIEDARVSFEPIPQYLVNRFGAGAKR